ncbi:MAG: rhomboid family intramembrane serine protease [candidate division KSB1 bacterium]|nr:rhomboid family intramembrane serine protease [candidate division KSB1 bacterium]
MGNHVKRAILCPGCGKLISANAESCIHCGMKNPGRLGIHTALQKLFRGRLELVQFIIYFCVGLFVVSLLLEPGAILKIEGFYNLLSPSNVSLFLLGGTGDLALRYGRWWTIITAIYLHGSLLHIFFNMLLLKQIGPLVQDVFGTARFMIIFTFSGAFGFILSNLLDGHLTIGASGSIFGLLGAMIYYGKARGGVFGNAVYRQLLIWAIVLFLFGLLSGTRVNNWAHLGGLAGGFVTATLFGYQEKRTETYRVRLLSGALIIITLVAFLTNLALLII